MRLNKHTRHSPARTELSKMMKLPAYCQLLHGAPSDSAAVVIGMDSDATTPLDWSMTLRPNGLSLILNLEGYGVALGNRIRLSMYSGMVGFLRFAADEPIHASRLPGQGRHRCLIISVQRQWLLDHFSLHQPMLHPLLQGELMGTPVPHEQIGQMRSISLAERDLGEMMLNPPVSRSLRPIWYQAKILECMALFGAKPNADSQDSSPRQQHIQQKVDEATLWLRKNYAEGMDLRVIARHVGCAPHYLSRLYRQHTGKTLSQQLRRIRIDQAAELLKSGTTVTEAAYEVGYNSLSHFTKAFAAEKGSLPSDYRK
jgi:AraC-like DNA-binding protein